MNKLIDALVDHNDLLIAVGIFDIIIVVLLELPGKVMGGWDTIISQNNFKGSSGVFLAAFILGAIVVHAFVFYRIAKTYRE